MAEQETPVVAAKDGETALDTQLRSERDLILGARDNPKETKMPGTGTTVADFKTETRKQQLEEGSKEIATNAQRMSEQSRKGDPIFAEGTAVVSTASMATVVPSATVQDTPPAKRPVDTGREVPASDLPTHFPFRGVLIEGGLRTRAAVDAATDAEIMALPHIDKIRLEQIRAWGKE